MAEINPFTGARTIEIDQRDRVHPRNNLGDLHDRAMARQNLQFEPTYGHLMAFQRLPIAVAAGVAAGTFQTPANAVVLQVSTETPEAITGTPTNTYLALGSSASGQDYVSNVDVKGQGGLLLTLLAPARLAANANQDVWHYTISANGGTTASQSGSVYVNILYGRASA